MTKPITAIAVMQLVEKGNIKLYEDISQYIPSFAELLVCKDNVLQEFYEADPNNPTQAGALQATIEQMTYVPAQRHITIFDLLNHSSGMEMGPISNTLAETLGGYPSTLQERVQKYAELPLDFQPRTASGYSPVLAFEVLAAVVEVVTGQSFKDYINEHILLPLGMMDTSFDTIDFKRLSGLYEYNEDEQSLTDVSDTDITWLKMDPLRTGYTSGAAGLYGTVDDYDKIAQMFLNGGQVNGINILSPDTIAKMSGQGISHDSRLFPAVYWGLGMSVMEHPERIHSARSYGSYGWSGAYGTHFVIDPLNHMTYVLGVNRSNIGGAGSPISFAVEEAIASVFFKN
ncbi:CubicO group peptidase (beta-lactamase class C family) [Streptococcus moroccensis]|uniref:CubicO group peptidase (Beta-lactamase class C family) n=1 Tax=Streptococcus moroccensis TaxID=1451356 RepID=A0ABT9YPB1_9STRE|nr:CubicO group peptidase (beta-lactamase class C family) [Streptococcus moroccensis]